MALTVSALADQAGLRADTIRYYERVGLLPEPACSAAGYRLYDQAAVGRLRLIKGAQRAGCGCARSASCSRSLTKASVPAGTPRPCCASGWPRSEPSSTACAPWRPTWFGCWSASPTAHPAAARPAKPAATRPARRHRSRPPQPPLRSCRQARSPLLRRSLLLAAGRCFRMVAHHGAAGPTRCPQTATWRGSWRQY